MIRLCEFLLLYDRVRLNELKFALIVSHAI